MGYRRLAVMFVFMKIDA